MGKAKLFLISICILFTINIFAYKEKVIINDIEYELDLSDNSASVKNFYGNHRQINIPAYINYKYDTFKVVSINAEGSPKSGVGGLLSAILVPDITNSVESMHAEHRVDIESIVIPNTVTYIDMSSFDNMIRLSSLAIPASVNHIYIPSVRELPRLKQIAIYGTPVIEYFVYLKLENNKIFNDDNTINEKYFEIAKTLFKLYLAPNLNEFIMPNAQKTISEYKRKQLEIERRRKNTEYELNKYTKQYNDSLRNNPWYCKDYTLSHSQITNDALSTFDKCKSWIKQEKNRIYKKYVELSSGDEMKNTLRTKYPDEYIVKAAKVNPDLNIQLREIDIEYRCMDESKINQIKIELIDNGKSPAPESSCRTKQYNENKRFFPSKEEFDTAYNNATSDSEFNGVLQKKKKQYKVLQYLSSTLDGNKNLNLCEGESASTSSKKGQIIHSVIDDMSSLSDKYFYDQGIEYIMQYCPKFKKDYEKNKIYFDSVDMFYHSYISANYKTILKQRINNYKNGIKQ